MKIRIVLYLAAFLLFLLCTCTAEKGEPQVKNRTDLVRQTAAAYFQTFAERKDWDKLLSFYREDLQFEDVMLQLKLDSLWQFKRFYKWDADGDNFRKLTPEQEHIVVKTLVANDSIVVARGYINPFYYYDELIDTEWGMEFTLWLYFDENLKIKRQIDWFEYAPEVFENVIKRIRENGLEKMPDWMDLSK